MADWLVKSTDGVWIGQYRKNTVAGVLQAERPELGRLLPVHRLDKTVSGVLLFARSPSAANALRQRIEVRSSAILLPDSSCWRVT